MDALRDRSALVGSAGRLGAAAACGAGAGAVIGGGGGRLAMLVLRLTSDPSLAGAVTDDGFVIGRFTSDTFFLVLFTTALGALGGVLYLVVRAWLPRRARAGTMAALAGVIGGAAVVHPDGIDFTVLDPLALAVAMFVALPGLYGAAVAVLVDRVVGDGAPEDGPRSLASVAGIVPLVALLALGPVGIVVVVVWLVAWAAPRVVPGLRGAWTSAPVTWGGRAILAAAGASGLVLLVQDVAEML